MSGKWKQDLAAADYTGEGGHSYQEHLLAKQNNLLEEQQRLARQENNTTVYRTVDRSGNIIHPSTAISYLLGCIFAYFVAVVFAGGNPILGLAYMVLPLFWGIAAIVGGFLDLFASCFR